jgi:hypothetical protein
VLTSTAEEKEVTLVETMNQHTYVEEARIVRGGTAAESVAGGVGIILAILGLLNVLPQMMLPIATIILGVALIFEGGAISSRFTKLLNETAKGRFETSEWGVGLTSEFIGGIATIILGILALLNIAPAVLLSVAAIVFGGTLILASGVTARLNHLQIPKSAEYDAFREVTREAVSVAMGFRVLLGLSTLVLGIIAVSGVNPMILVFVSLLCVGVSDLTNGGTLTARMMGMLHS